MTPNFNTSVSVSVNGHETRNSYQAYPLWDFELSYEWLPNRVAGKQDLETIVSFFLARQGSFESFLFLAPETPLEDMTVLGTGNGLNVTFSLVKTTGSFVEPAGGIPTKTDIQLFKNGSIVDFDDFELSDYRDIIFNSPPAPGDIIQGSYTPLYRARFKEDSAQFDQFMSRLWELQQINLRSVFS